MPISNFPAQLQVILEDGFLEHEFQKALESKAGYSDVTDVEEIPNRVGESVIKTRPGLLAPATTPLTSAQINSNLDNGLTDQNHKFEQFELSLNRYGATMSLNTVEDRLLIADQALLNADRLGKQAFATRERLVRDALFAAHLSGNTRVAATLGAPAVTVAVDDIRGFQEVLSSVGRKVAVSVANPLTVTIGAGSYTCTGATADGVNVSSIAAIGGISGTLTLSGNVSVANGTAGNPVVAATAPTIIRPNGRSNTSSLINTDLLTLKDILRAVDVLRDNCVPTIDGSYNFYLPNAMMSELHQDPDFKQAYTGRFDSESYKKGVVADMYGVRFITTTEAYLQSLGGVNVKRGILVGAGAIIEGRMPNFRAATGVGQSDGYITEKNGVVFVMREPLDRFQETIAQSWKMIVGFSCPTDMLADTTIIPTASNAYHKRAVVIESA